MDSILQLYDNYFHIKKHKYITDNGEYSEQLFHDLFSEVNQSKIYELFVFLMKKVSFTKDQIKLMINLGIDINLLSCHANDLLNSARINNLCYLVDNHQIENWILNIQNIRPERLQSIIISCNDAIFQILFDSGMSFKEIMVNSNLISDKITDTQKKFFTELDGKITEFLIRKVLTVEQYIDPIFLSKLLYCLMFNKDRLPNLNEFQQFVQLGVDPRYDDDVFFIMSCRAPSQELILFLVNNYGCDVNARNSVALLHAIKSCPDNIKILFKLGIDINYDTMNDSYIYDHFYDNEFIDLLISCGADIYKIANIAIKPLECHHIKILRKLINSGVDMNKLIAECDSQSIDPPNIFLN